MTKTELKSIIRNTILEAINDFPADMERALKQSKKKGDHEQSAYYTQALESMIQRGGSAFVSWDRFKGSWAYEQWIKKPETQKLIKDIKADYDRFSYMRETNTNAKCEKCKSGDVHKNMTCDKCNDKLTTENAEMAQSDVTKLIDYSEKLQSLIDANGNLEDWVKAKLTIACDYVANVRDYLKFYTEEQEMNTQNIQEKWSSSYKKSIDCSNAKGFSQKAHCAARRKRQAGGNTSSKSVKEYYKESVLEILKQQNNSMAIGELKQLNNDAQELETMIQVNTELEDWVKARLTLASSNLESVFGYLNNATKNGGADECMTEANQQSLTELAGITPMIGQNKYDYVVTTLYKGSNSQTVKSLSPIFATDEVEAKKLATAPYNRSVVTIVSVKVTNVGSVTQADIDAYNKGVKGTYDSIRRFGTTN